MAQETVEEWAGCLELVSQGTNQLGVIFEFVLSIAANHSSLCRLTVINMLEYEPKDKTITHTFDKQTKTPGAKTFKLEVTDDRGNMARYETSFTH